MTTAKAHPHEKPHHPHLALAALLFLFVLLLGIFSVHEGSTWIHIRTGAKIVADRALPAKDPFSYLTVGRHWTTTSWLCDVLFFALHRSFGPQGLVAFKSLIAACAFSLLLPINPASPLTAATVLGLGAVASWTGLTEKPAIFDLLMIALLVRLLRPRKPLRWSVVLQAALVELLWANLHGARAAIGLWMAALKAFKNSLRAGKGERAKCAALFAAAVLGFACNPHGLGLVEHAFSGLGAYGNSWRPLSGWLNLYAVFAAAGLASCFIVLQQEFFLTLNAATLLVFSLLVPAIRCAYVLAACPVIALAVGHALAPKPVNALRFARWAGLMAALFWMHWVAIYVPLGRWRGYGVTSLDGVLHYLRDNGVRGHLFNEAEAGAYLIGGGVPVFVDERSSPYERSLIKDAARWPVSFRSLDGIYRFDYAVLLNRRAGYPARVLDEDPAWRLAYADDVALVYIRRAGASGLLVQNTPPRLVAPNRLWPDGLDEPLKKVSSVPRVLSELDRWILDAPDATQPLIWKAYALDRLKLSVKADRWMSMAEGRRGLSDPELMSAAALFYAGRGRFDSAEKLLSRAEQIAQRRADAGLQSQILQRLGWLCRQKGDPERARAYEDQAVRLAPSLLADD